MIGSASDCLSLEGVGCLGDFERRVPAMRKEDNI